MIIFNGEKISGRKAILAELDAYNNSFDRTHFSRNKANHSRIAKIKNWTRVDKATRALGIYQDEVAYQAAEIY